MTKQNLAKTRTLILRPETDTLAASNSCGFTRPRAGFVRAPAHARLRAASRGLLARTCARAASRASRASRGFARASRASRGLRELRARGFARLRALRAGWSRPQGGSFWTLHEQISRITRHIVGLLGAVWHLHRRTLNAGLSFMLARVTAAR